MAGRCRLRLQSELEAARRGASRLSEDQHYQGGRGGTADQVWTGLSREQMRRLLIRMTDLPANFHLHPQLRHFLNERRRMAAEERPLDWSTAEALAFATLAVEGRRVRLTGQDSERGTFGQRHAVLHDVTDGRTYSPLQHLHAQQAPVEIWNSPLSEMGVLGFEYGYSLDYPDALVLWEAQFGDFVNTAQVIVDQFLAGAEDKWNRFSGLVLLLPHGLEGRGPEHASGRIERFLSLCAEENMQVAMPSTPAQYFHILRRQMLQSRRTPLILFTPKSLLSQGGVTSSLTECETRGFRPVLPDPGRQRPARCARQPGGAQPARRLLLCSGRVYYELHEERRASEEDEVVLVRLEQFYPFPELELAEALAPFPIDLPVIWVQEEPRNMGVWPYLRYRFGDRLGSHPLRVASRPEASTPASGSAASHRLEQERLIDGALRGNLQRPGG